jgi:predicted aspartyl protease
MRVLEQHIDKRRILLPISVLRPGNAADITSFAATALLDTGATVSGIGPRVIETLNLRSYGKKQLLSATELVFVDYYLFRIGLFDSRQAASDNLEASDLPFMFEELDGFSWRRPSDFDVILGMDVIRQCDLAIYRDGRLSLSFG